MVIIVVGLTRISGGSMASIYLKRGKIRLWLTIGLIVFSLCFLIAIWPNIDDENYQRQLTFILVFALANGIMGELLFRGLFLNHLTNLLGPWTSILLTSILFSLAYGFMLYTPALTIPAVIAFRFLLGLVLGFVIQKTDSLWGAILIHAGSDLTFISVYSVKPLALRFPFF
jgi:membrane protease YdiL (CAAX protease family)